MMMRRLGLFGVIGIVLASMGLTACEPSVPNDYVALGDSYTAGPLTPNQPPTPLGCLRSDKNSPPLVFPNIKAKVFKDVSCSGATTNSMYAAQNVPPGPANPPQLNAVTPNA